MLFIKKRLSYDVSAQYKIKTYKYKNTHKRVGKNGSFISDKEAIFHDYL